MLKLRRTSIKTRNGSTLSTTLKTCTLTILSKIKGQIRITIILINKKNSKRGVHRDRREKIYLTADTLGTSYADFSISINKHYLRMFSSYLSILIIPLQIVFLS